MHKPLFRYDFWNLPFLKINVTTLDPILISHDVWRTIYHSAKLSRSLQVKVSWHCISTQSPDKSPYWKLGFCLIGSRGIIWNQLQTFSHCVIKTWFLLKWKVKIVYPLNSVWKDRSDWLSDNNNLTSRHVKMIYQLNLFWEAFFLGVKLSYLLGTSFHHSTSLSVELVFSSNIFFLRYFLLST